MDISSLRSQFTVFVVENEISVAQVTAEMLKSAGYQDTQFYPTLDSALVMARENPPHILAFDFEHLEAVSESFLSKFLDISPETLVILMGESRQVLSMLQIVAHARAYDFITRPMASTLEIVQKIDRAATRLYFQFENEQLRERFELNESRPVVPSAHSRESSPLREFNRVLSRFNATKDVDQTIQILMESVSDLSADTPVLYFKYVPSHMSLLLAQTTWLPMEKFRGIGLDLKKEEPNRLLSYFENPSEMVSLRTLIGEVFRKNEFTAFAHLNEGEALGVFVILSAVDVDGEGSPIAALRKMFELAFKRNLTLKEKHSLDVSDALTGVSNRKHFARRLDEEISRSRRLRMPLSLITIDVDRFHQLNERIGYRQADTVLKTIAAILKKTMRTNDVIGRIGPDEFALLLPHTGNMGAAVKAERVRRIIEATKIPLLEALGLGGLTVSAGVSEYPSFCADAESLLRSADEAQQQVKNAGGNKVCLSSAPAGFQMDFIPLHTGPDPRSEGVT